MCGNHNPATDPTPASSEIKQEPQSETTPESHEGHSAVSKLVENCTALVQILTWHLFYLDMELLYFHMAMVYFHMALVWTTLFI